MPEQGSLDVRSFVNNLKCHVEDTKTEDNLNSILNAVRDSVVAASSGFMHPECGNLMELKKKIEYLILAFRSSDPTIFTLNEHHLISNLEDCEQPGFNEVYENGESLYVSIASRITSRYYPFLLKNHLVFKTAFLEEFIPQIDLFLLDADIITTLKLKAFAAGFLNVIRTSETSEFRELREIVLSINRFCSSRMLQPDEKDPSYFKDLNFLYVRLKNILLASRIKEGENN